MPCVDPDALRLFGPGKVHHPDDHPGDLMGSFSIRRGRRGTNVSSPDTATQAREEPMSDLQAIADRFEIEALRGEFTDAS
jgi:hypothetical protein